MSDHGRVIVSRHYGAIEFIARELGAHPTDGIDYYWDCGAWTNNRHEVAGLTTQCGPPDRVVVNVVPSEPGATDGRIPVLTGNVGPEDVAGLVVYGNLPLHLAALASQVYAVEFSGPPPRGSEYTLADMAAAGARLRRYKILALGVEPTPEIHLTREQARLGGYCC